MIYLLIGQETFHSITRSYYRGAIGCILTYDVTRRQSFENIVRWYDDATNFGGKDMKFTLVANKIDLADQRVVQTDEGHDFATERNMEFVEVSAKQAVNINEMFEVTASSVLEGIRHGQIDVTDEVT